MYSSIYSKQYRLSLSGLVEPCGRSVEETQKAVITPPKMRRGRFDMQNDRMTITLGDVSPLLADLLAENSAVASTAGYIKHLPFQPK